MTNQDRIQQIRQKLEANWQSLPIVTQQTDIVPGDGNANADILLIGEAAGRNEAIQHKPFVGVAGRLMTGQLAVNGYTREQVYITNVVKCRPPENRDPTPEEIEAFRPYLDEEIEVVQPKLIITLGRFSMGKFLPDVKISQVHGRLYRVTWNGKRQYVLPFYHPAAALRRGIVLDAFKQDFAKLPKIMEYITQNIQEKDTTEETVEAIKESLF